jgi:hypothetical protein
MTFLKKVIPAWHGINDNNQMKRFSEVQEIFMNQKYSRHRWIYQKYSLVNN